MLCPFNITQDCAEDCALYDTHTEKCAFLRTAEEQEHIAKELEFIGSELDEQAAIPTELGMLEYKLKDIEGAISDVAERIC